MAIEKSTSPADDQMQEMDRRIDRAMKWFSDLQGAVDRGDSDAVRGFFRELMDRVELTFEATPIGTGKGFT